MSYRVCWDDLTLAIIVWDRANQSQHTVAKAQIWMNLLEDQSPPKSNDVLEYLEQHSGRMNINEIPSLLKNISIQCKPEKLGISLEFPYFRSNTTALPARFDVSLLPNSKIDFVLKIHVWRTPQHKITVSIRSEIFVWIEALEEALMSIKISEPTNVREQIKEKLAVFQPSWSEVIYTEKKEDVTCSHTWTWENNEFPKSPIPELSRSIIHQTFGEWLKEQRMHRKLSQQELASALKVSNSNLSRVESGVKVPTITLLNSLSKHWGYSIDHLMLRARHPSNEMLEALAGDIDGFLHWMNSK
jgi:DNA-binding XRE family transcriptional regulator